MKSIEEMEKGIDNAVTVMIIITVTLFLLIFLFYAAQLVVGYLVVLSMGG